LRTQGLRREPGISLLLALLLTVLVGSLSLIVTVTKGIGAGRTQSSASSVTQASTSVTGFPFDNPNFLDEEAGSCTGATGISPCFGSRSIAEEFNCLSAAATTNGCTKDVVSGNSLLQYRYQIKIWYPHSGPPNGYTWINCVYTESGDRGATFYAYCNPTNSTAFVVSLPGPPVL
jgi:hypothetical protein